MKNNYWLVTWGVLSQFGETKHMDVWKGTLIELINLINKANPNCAVYILWAHPITPIEFEQYNN